MLWLVDCSRRSGRAEKFSPELQATAPGSAGCLLCGTRWVPAAPAAPRFMGDMQECPLCPSGCWHPALLTASICSGEPSGAQEGWECPPRAGQGAGGCSRLGTAEGPQQPSQDVPGGLQQVEVLVVTCALLDGSITSQGCQTAGGSLPFSSSIFSQDHTSPQPALGWGGSAQQ